MENTIKNAVKELRKGNFVMVHDSSSREDETDLVIAAEFVKPENVATMRIDGGGLICLSVEKEVSESLSLPFICEMQEYSSDKYPLLECIKANDIPYDDKSSFSVTINHRKTFTGISDEDRAKTIHEFAKLIKETPRDNIIREMGRNFRSPGHVSLLISSGLKNRGGHTELSTALLNMAKLTPVATIVEMLDSKTHKSLSKEKAQIYAKERKIVFLEGKTIKEAYDMGVKISV